MNNEVNRNAYLAFRYVEGICIAVFVFGFLWEGTELLKLTLPEFMMLYGGMGAVLSEFLARLFYKQIKKKRTQRGKTGGSTQWIALSIVCALIVALLGGVVVLFETQAMWDMDSPNAQSWNATMNTTATFGVNIIPMLVIVIVAAVALGLLSTARGF